MLVKEESATQEILREEVACVKHADLKEALRYRFSIHHAGMVKGDQETVEDLLREGLYCTATLAGGSGICRHTW